eukprot:Skav218414  [mRNA]  locus=scaffold4660:6598:7062:- [translate_table: standard]
MLINFVGMRKEALTTGVQPMSVTAPAAIADVSGSASSSSSGPLARQPLQRGISNLRFEQVGDDDLVQKDLDPDVILVDKPSQPSSVRSDPPDAMSKPTKPSGASALCVFKLVHKNPAGLKRPLSAVDNLRSDDIAIREYDVVWNDSWAGQPLYM